MLSSTLVTRGLIVATLAASLSALPAVAAKPLDGFEAHPPIHVKCKGTDECVGLAEHGHGGGASAISLPGFSPAAIKAAYNLPATGGAGATIAIVDAYDNPNAERDLATFSTQFSLPSCTTANGCFEKHSMAPRVKADQGWALEEALDTQWAHAVAPQAKILLVVAKSASGNDLLAAVDYARARAGVVAVSMSWGGNEFSGEAGYDYHFAGPAFFASSGDSGAGVSWPAVSPNVVAVGGTTLTSTTSTYTETAWSGSGGGVSSYEPKPAYQAGITAGGRAVPDVSYVADPNTGFPVYDSYGYQGFRGWFLVGGTSAGAPQWAAIYALGHSATNAAMYADASVPATYASHFRDIIAGTNGTCGAPCTAGAGYDLVTGLGSPLTTAF